MTTDQHNLASRIHVILQRALVEARNLASGRRCDQIFDLADIFEIIPKMLLHWEDANLDAIRRNLAHYQSKYQDTAYDYLAILNMDEHQFEEIYLSAGFAKSL